jgi:5-methylcytosine-specific restriction enzyme subunit McrC
LENPDITTLLSKARRAFLGSSSFIKIRKEDIKEPPFTRINEHYKKAISLAIFIIRHLEPKLKSGGKQTQAFYVSMWKLFEDYVSKRLKKENNYNVIIQNEEKIGTGNQITIKPDIILETGNKKYVMDVKYKNNKSEPSNNNVIKPSDKDLYQMIAYCHALSIEKAFLIYPSDVNYSTKVEGISIKAIACPIENDLKEGWKSFIKTLEESIKS